MKRSNRGNCASGSIMDREIKNKRRLKTDSRLLNFEVIDQLIDSGYDPKSLLEDLIRALDAYTVNDHAAGYFNTTSAIDEIQFKMSSDAIDAGDICLYGIN